MSLFLHYDGKRGVGGEGCDLFFIQVVAKECTAENFILQV